MPLQQLLIHFNGKEIEKVEKVSAIRVMMVIMSSLEINEVTTHYRRLAVNENVASH